MALLATRIPHEAVDVAVLGLAAVPLSVEARGVAAGPLRACQLHHPLWSLYLFQAQTARVGVMYDEICGDTVIRRMRPLRRYLLIIRCSIRCNWLSWSLGQPRWDI